MAWKKTSRLHRLLHVGQRRNSRSSSICLTSVAAVLISLKVFYLPESKGFVPLRNLVPSWILHAEADEGRAAAVAAVPPLEWAQAHDDWRLQQFTQEAEPVETSEHEEVRQSSEEPFEMSVQPSMSSGKADQGSTLELVQSVLQTLLVAGHSEDQHGIAENESAPKGMAAAGAFFTLAAGMVSQEAASLLKTIHFSEDVARRALSGVPIAAAEDALKALSTVEAHQGMPALLASSLMLASAVAAVQGSVALPSEVLGGYHEGLQAINSTAQKLWERGTGSLGSRASTLLYEARRLWEAFDNEPPINMQGAADPRDSAATFSHGIAVRSGSARRDGEDWILPIEAQLFRRNEGRHAMVLGLCRQLLFRNLHGISDQDFDSKASELYEERARLIFRSFQLPLSSNRALQHLEVRVGGRNDDEEKGWRALPPTDAYGLVEANLRISEDDIALADRLRGRVPVEVRLAESRLEELDPTERAPTSATARTVAHLVGEEGLGVISDIDDTVKVTEVFHGVGAVLKNTFLRNFSPVKGMAELFQGWSNLKGASFHYVSKSPPELHGPLSEFLAREGFPVSSLHLCPLLGRDRGNFKLRQVTSLLSQFPQRKFLLVGDSGEKDAEVYAEILRRYPDQVQKALIRVVASGERGNEEKARAAFEGLDAEKWQVFSDPSEVTLPMEEDSSWPTWLRLPGSSTSGTKVVSVVEATAKSLRRFGWKKKSTVPLEGVVLG